jgi:hypothetical protein
MNPLRNGARGGSMVTTTVPRRPHAEEFCIRVFKAHKSPMKSALSSVLLGAGAIAACLLLLGVPNNARAQPKHRAKRDISGIWESLRGLGGPGGFNPATPRGQLEKVLLTSEYEARYKSQFAAVIHGDAVGKPLAGAMSKCLPLGMPQAFGDVFPFEIVLTPKVIYVLPEAWDPPVRIFMDGRKIPALDDLEPSYEGLSVGHWEGDTLVVETAGVKTSSLIGAGAGGVPHSDAMRITERIQVVDNDTLSNEITITDPKAFLTPWVIKKIYKDYAVPLGAKDSGKPPEHSSPIEMTEYICNENNRNLPDANGVNEAIVGGG